jgi:hypothetical protein
MTARMKEIRKIGRPQKIWTDEVEYVKTVGIINWHRVARDREEWEVYRKPVFTRDRGA